MTFKKQANCVLVRLLLTLTCFLPSAKLLAQVDELQEVLTSKQPRPLRWGNVENGDQWLAGVKPFKSGGRYQIRLTSNSETVLRLPAASYLKLMNVKQYSNKNTKQSHRDQNDCRDVSNQMENKVQSATPISHENPLIDLNELIRIEQSNDGYLFIEKQWLATNMGTSWLADVQAYQASAIRLSLLKQSSEQHVDSSVKCVEFEVYYSQYTRPVKLANYRKAIYLDDTKVEINAQPTDGSQVFNSINSGEAKLIEIVGPVDLEIQLRKELLNHVPIKGDINIELSLNGDKAKKITSEYFPEIKQSVDIDGKKSFMSRLSKVYFSVPKGKHKLTIKTYSDVYLRILKQEDDDYLFFGLNHPKWYDFFKKDIKDNHNNHNNKNNKNNKDSQISESEWREGSKKWYQENRIGFSAVYQSIQTLARNNAIYNSGLAAITLLTNELGRSVDRPFVDKLVNRMELTHGKFKSLYPVYDGQTVGHKLERFVSRQLGDRNRQDIFNFHPNYLDNISLKLKEEYITNIPQASFFSMDAQQSRVFSLPERSNLSKIRIIIPRQIDQKTDLTVTLDNGLEYFIRSSSLPIDDKHFILDLTSQIIKSQCCAEILNRVNNTPINEIGMISIPIASSISSFVISSNTDESNWAAVQIYTDNNHQLAEEEYINLIKTKKATYSDFQHLVWEQNKLLLDNVKSAPKGLKIKPSVTHASRLLNNQWLPLARQFSSIYQEFSADLDLQSVFPKNRQQLSNKQYRKLKAQALHFEKSKQWVVSIEIWSEIVKRTKAEQQVAALFKLENALLQQGHYRMAEKLLKALALQSDNLRVSSLAFDKLIARYTASNLPDKRHKLIVSSLVKFAHNDLIIKAIDSLVEKGQWLNALQLTQLLPVETRPRKSVLLAAAKLNWWLTFSQTLLLLPEREQQVWRGHADFMTGKFSKARNTYKQIVSDDDSNKEAQQWFDFTDQLQLLLQEISFRGKILYKDPSFIERWLKLSSINPSIKVWKRAPKIVNQHGGGIKLFNPQRLISFDGFVSSKDTPIELEVVGPVKMRLSVRPVINKKDAFKNNFIVPQKSSYQIIRQGKVYSYPIIDSVASSSLEIENSDQVVGSADVNEFQLGEGIHRLKIISQQPVAIFPELLLNVMSMPGIVNFDHAQIISHLSQSSVSPIDNDDFSPIEDKESNLYQQLVNYLVMMTGESENKKQLKSSRLSASQILALAKDQFEKYSKNNVLSDRLINIMNKVSQHASWRPVSNIIQSAGIRQLEHKYWQAESPNWKSYIALFNKPLDKSRILTSGQPISLSVFNTHKTDLNLQVESLRPWFLTREPVHFYYRVNNGAKKMLTISSLKNISLPLDAGNQTIQFEINRTEYDHFLWFKLSEKDGRSVEKNIRKNYHLSSHEEPFEAVVDGPAWIRIDRLEGAQTTSHYQFISQKEFKLTVLPNINNTEALLRVFEWHIGSKSDQSVTLLPRKKKIESVRRAETVDLLNTDQESLLVDSLAIDRQVTNTQKLVEQKRDNEIFQNNWQDGTLSLYSSFSKRHSVEDEPGSEIDDFLSLGANYRYYQAFDNIWYKYSGGLRVRGDSDDSLVLHGSALGRFNWAPLNWKLSADFHAQELDTSTAIASKFDFSISQVRQLGIKSSHRPKLNIFSRAHKLDYTETEFIDSDIYTDYKAQHLYGMKISDRYSYKPYLDSEFYASGSILSNQDIFEIDQWAVNFGFSQLLGDFLLKLQVGTTLFQKDDDRELQSQQTKLGLKLGWEFWRKNTSRFEASFDYQHNFEQSDNNINLQFIYHMSSGRNYRDFSPEEISFRNIRQSMIPLGDNNEKFKND